jgi:hypothetical protein
MRCVGWSDMNYDDMTREQAVELLRSTMESIKSLDVAMLEDQRKAQAAARSQLYVDADPSPPPVDADADLERRSASTHEVALRMIRANDQARRALRLVEWRTHAHAKRLGVLAQADEAAR